jgi:uncharacterized protein YkwD
MLDGSVRALREALAGVGHAAVPVAAMIKLESRMYGSHRRAVEAIPVVERAVPLIASEDRDAGRARAARDVAAGADVVIVKPGLGTQDLVSAIAVVLVSLVLAAFTLPRSRPAQTLVGPAGASAERVAPVARGIERVRDEPPMDMTAAAPQVPVALEAVATPEATPEPTPEPTAEPTPRPTPQPTPRPTPVRTIAPVLVTGSTADAERRMLVLINASRVAGGLAPLALDGNVSVTARAHSQVESEYGYVYHDGPDGTAKSRNVPACGTGWYGENTGKIWNGNVDALHIEFMNEPWIPINHRTNIMDPNFVRVGIGAVQGRDALYMTMVFCR